MAFWRSSPISRLRLLRAARDRIAHTSADQLRRNSIHSHRVEVAYRYEVRLSGCKQCIDLSRPPRVSFQLHDPIERRHLSSHPLERAGLRRELSVGPFVVQLNDATGLYIVEEIQQPLDVLTLSDTRHTSHKLGE